MAIREDPGRITFRIGRFLGQTSLGAQLGFGTQPHYEAPSDLRVEVNQNAVINIRLVKAASATVAQSWLWGSQIAVKKKV